MLGEGSGDSSLQRSGGEWWDAQGPAFLVETQCVQRLRRHLVWGAVGGELGGSKDQGLEASKDMGLSKEKMPLSSLKL